MDSTRYGLEDCCKVQTCLESGKTEDTHENILSCKSWRGKRSNHSGFKLNVNLKKKRKKREREKKILPHFMLSLWDQSGVDIQLISHGVVIA